LANWYHYAAAFGLAAAQSLGASAQEESAAPSASTAQGEQVILEADYVYENSEDNTIVAEGNVEALYDGRTLRADRLVYNRTTERVRATGNVVIIDQDGTQQFSDEVEVGSNLTDGYAIGYSARLVGGGTVVANSAIRQSNGINAMDQVIYTACPICAEDVTPTWSLRARRAVLDQNSQMISYRDAVFEVMGLPVFYFPYLAHPDPSSDRRTGLLIPSVGLSSKLGTFYQQPYYWALSDYSDLTISPLISENVNPMLELDFRKRFYSGAIDINTSFTHEADFDSDGIKFGDEKWRGHLYGSGRFAISPEWQWGFGVETQTDDLYDRRYDIEGQGKRRGIYLSQPRRLLSQLYAVGQGDSYYTDVAMLSFQGLRAGDVDGSLPTITPLYFGEKYWDLGDYGFASVNASTAVLTRDVGSDSRRASVGADWSTLRVLPGGFTFKPFAELRGDYYSLEKQYAGTDSASRVVGNTGVELSYPLVRPGENVDIMVEPTVMAAWGFSNVNDPNIPNEDSLLFEADASNLFQPSATSGYDLYEGDGKISAGLTTRAVWKNGTQISTTVGRRWRSRSDPSFSEATNLDGTTSDWVVSATADMGSLLRVDTQMRLDDDGFSLNTIDTRFTTQVSRLRATGQYYKIDKRVSPLGRDDEGVFLRGELRVTKRYSVIFGQLRDIANNLNARKEIGIAYEDECSRLELVYARSELRDRTLGPSENIQVRFSLKTIGQFGSDKFD